MELTPDQRKTILGRMGEICVANWANSESKSVFLSIDPFDSTKDMTIDGQTVEVKTQVPWVSERAFTIGQNQLEKCQNVDNLYFVALLSPSGFEYSGQGHIFKADKNFFWELKTTKSGKKQISIPINQAALNKVYRISSSDLNTMMRYVTSQ